VINTCTVTANADSDSLGAIRRAQRENPQARIIVTGCLAELDGNIIKAVGRKISVLKKQRIAHSAQRITHFKGHTRAFLKIQDGCDNFCSYCKVPLVRGRSRSRPIEEIIQEAEQLAKNGFKEIVLTGICLGAFNHLVELLGELEKIAGLLRIRLSSIEPQDVTDKLIAKISDSEKICPHLHIPLQSGDDEILKKMNRKYSAADYLRLIGKIKKRIPQIAITTDVIVGFPQEKEANFKNTIVVIKKILPLRVHIFPYSKREGTSAAVNFKGVSGRRAGLNLPYGDEVSAPVVKERILRLKDISEKCALDYKRQFLHKKLNVLIESRSKEKPGFWSGYSGNYIKVMVKSKLNLKNQFISVKLNKIGANSSIADLIEL